MGFINCTNNVWELRFSLCDGKLYVIIPQAEKGLHNILDCFKSSQSANVKVPAYSHVPVPVS